MAGTAWLPPTAARAQAAASLSVESDYRLRGLSITGDRPAASLALSYDFAGGAYAGGSVIAAAPPGHELGVLGHIEYLGYVLKTEPGRTLDFGVTDTQWTSYSPAPPALYGGGQVSHDIHYSEVYAAAATEHLRASVQYSPNYIATRTQAFYFDLSGSANPAPNWRVFAHAGYLDPIRPSDLPAFHTRSDWRVGVSRAIGPASLHVAVASHAGAVPAGQTRTAVIAGADLFF